MEITIRIPDEDGIFSEKPENVLNEEAKTGLIIFAYLQGELSLNDVAKTLNKEVIETGEWLNKLGIVQFNTEEKVKQDERQPLNTTNTPTKWQKLSERIMKNPPLRGAGERILNDSKAFRENFAFGSD